MIFVLEINATAILAFEADSLDDARAYAASAGEQEDLTELRSNGAPLWNGKDVITARDANEAEADLFKKSREEDWEDEPHSDPEDFITYLVPLDEPEED